MTVFSPLIALRLVDNPLLILLLYLCLALLTICLIDSFLLTLCPARTASLAQLGVMATLTYCFSLSESYWGGRRRSVPPDQTTQKVSHLSIYLSARAIFFSGQNTRTGVQKLISWNVLGQTSCKHPMGYESTISRTPGQEQLRRTLDDMRPNVHPRPKIIVPSPQNTREEA